MAAFSIGTPSVLSRTILIDLNGATQRFGHSAVTTIEPDRKPMCGLRVFVDQHDTPLPVGSQYCIGGNYLPALTVANAGLSWIETMGFV